MGAAIRYGSRLLSGQPAARCLLLLSDGRPNDLDKYEGRYRMEDSRQGVLEARRFGLRLCVTIEDRANNYPPHLFGSGGYRVIRSPAKLPKQLTALYARLTA